MARVDRVILVVMVLVAARTYAASPELGVPFDVPPGTGHVAAFDGTNYLLAWSSGGEIRAARVSPLGVLLDPGGVRVAAGTAGRHKLAVAYTGGVFLVAWVEFRDVAGPPPLPWDAARSHFFFVRVDPHGTVLDPSPGLVTTMESCSIPSLCEYAEAVSAIALAEDGTNFLLSGSAYFKHVAAVVAPTGEVRSVRDNPMIPGTGDILAAGPHAVAFDGTQYLMVASDWNTFRPFGLRFTRDGAAIPPVFRLGTAIPYSRWSTSVASSGRTSLGTWTTEETLGTAVYRGRFDADGLLDSAPLAVRPWVTSSEEVPLATVWDGCQYVAAWMDRAARVSEDGAVLDDPAWSLAGPISAMATDGRGTVLVLSGATGQLIRTCAPAVTAPVFDPPPSPVVEATSPAGAVVTFAVTARNANGPAVVVCAPASGGTFPLGTTPVLCVASDALDPSLLSSASFDVVVRDTTPPTLRLPSGVVAPATTPDGAAVAYTVVAADRVDPAPAVTCTPASGGRFPVGVTTVSCWARDASGNTSPSGAFPVRVQGVAEQIAQLIALVDSFGLAPGVQRSLEATLGLAAGNVGSCTRACDLMSVFLVETAVARWTGAMSADQAARLGLAARRSRGALGGGQTCR